MSDPGMPQPLDEKSKLTLVALTTSPNTYMNPDGPSNADKINVVRESFNCPRGDIFTTFPYEDIYKQSSPQGFRAAYYFCDLRIQALDRLIQENEGNLTDHYQRRLINLSWKVRFRERINLHNAAVMNNDRTGNTVH